MGSEINFICLKCSEVKIQDGGTFKCIKYHSVVKNKIKCTPSDSSSSEFPIPDSIKSLGESITPAVTMTSLVAFTKCVSPCRMYFTP